MNLLTSELSVEALTMTIDGPPGHFGGNGEAFLLRERIFIGSVFTMRV